MAVVFLCEDLSGIHTLPATRFLIALEYCKCSYFLLPNHQKLSKVHFLFFSSSSLGEICKRVSKHPIAPAARQII